MKQKLNFNVIDGMFMLLIILVPVISIPWHGGIEGCDQSSYTFFAKKFATTGELEYRSLFGAPRIVAWILQSIFIYLFGVSASITWVTTLQFCILLLVIYFFLRTYDQVVAFYSVALLAFSTLLIRESTIVMGDIMLTLLVNLPLLIYWRYIKYGGSTRWLKWGIVAGIFWIAAFFTKESALYYLVVCVCFSAAAYYKKLKPDAQFWSSFWITVILGTILSGLWFYFATGNPFHKFTVANDAITKYSLDSSERVWKDWKQLTAGELAYRYTLQPLTFFILDYTMGLLGLLTLFYWRSFRKFSNGFWGWYLIILLAVWWWFPQRLAPFYPMRLTYRLWLPLMVPLAINAAHGIKLFIARQDTKWDRVLVGLGGIILIGVSLVFFRHSHDVTNLQRMIFYSITLVFLFVATLVKENEILPDLRKVAFVIMLLPFFYHHYNRFEWWGYSKTQQESALDAKKMLEARNARKVFVSSCLVPFYQLYQSTIQFVSYEDSTQKEALHDAYLMLDKTQDDHPFEAGFTFIDENERYQLYYHQ